MERMSYWAHITGTVTVEPFGRTQAEMTYILESVLNHLPVVSGSEGGMKSQYLIADGDNTSCSTDEFGENTLNVEENGGWIRTQDKYIIVLSADLRDRMFKQTHREFINWLCRLSKRVRVEDVLVKITADDLENENGVIIDNRNNCFSDMFEYPSWCGKDSVNWCEYLMWESVSKDCRYPALLCYKYVEHEKNDARVEAWLKKPEKLWRN